MSYKDYSDNDKLTDIDEDGASYIYEQDYNNDSFGEDNEASKGMPATELQDYIKDPIINDLKKLANKQDIKGLRNYINIYRQQLNKYKTRLLNENIKLNGYKFLRKDGKLILIKTNSGRMSIAATPIKTAPKGSANGCNSNEQNEDNNSEAAEEPLKLSSANKIENDKEPLKIVNIEDDTNKINQYEPYNSKSINDALSIKTTPIISNAKDDTIKTPIIMDDNNTMLKDSSYNAYGAGDLVANFMNGSQANQQFNGSLINFLNSLSEQANKQNETQKQQYEQLTRTLNDSITARNIAEQERSNKFNNCIDIIEKTFSAGTFDKIVESINNMVQTLTNKQEQETTQIKQNIEFLNNDISEILATIENIKNKPEEEPNNNTELIEELQERNEELNTIIDELQERTQAQEDEIRKLKENINKAYKLQEDKLNKILLCLYNSVDDEIFNKIFPEIADNEQKSEQEDPNKTI